MDTYNQRGITFIIVLGMFLVIAILTNVILVIIESQAKQTTHIVNRTRAYYADLAGMYLAVNNLRGGTWGTGSYSLCSSGCTVNDSTIPYRVNISISDPGSYLNTEVRQIQMSATY